MSLISEVFSGKSSRWTGRRSRVGRRILLEQLESRSMMAVDTQPFARIINGSVTSDFPSVGLVGDSSGNFCSGTLIAPQYVLTAAHCAEGVANTAGRFRLGTATYSTSQVFVHPNYNSNLIGSDEANDIAIYRLSQPVTNVTPSPIFRGTPLVGQLLTLVGFGGGGTGNTGTDGSFGTKRVGTTPIDQVTTKLIRWNFDNNSEANTAPGDSGGPAFLQVNGVYQVAGVTSGGDREDAGIGDRSFDTRVDAFAAWIDSIVGNATTQTTVSIVASDSSAAETTASQVANPGSFVISRTGATTSPLTVSIGLSGSAINGTDYASIANTITIPAGASSVTLTLAPTDDAIVEGTESAIVGIIAGSGYSVGTSASASVTIADNDVPTNVSNDMFANRRPLAGMSTTVTGSNAGATRESGEPNIQNVSGGKSVWWTWTAPVNGTVVISTSGSSFDTTLGVYRGTAVGSLSLVASNDDQNASRGVFTSRVSFTAIAGQVFQILVDGYQGATGNIKLNLTQTQGRTRSTDNAAPPVTIAISNASVDSYLSAYQSASSGHNLNPMYVSLEVPRFRTANLSVKTTNRSSRTNSGSASVSVDRCFQLLAGTNSEQF